jgi:hypothetical protein
LRSGLYARLAKLQFTDQWKVLLVLLQRSYSSRKYQALAQAYQS